MKLWQVEVKFRNKKGALEFFDKLKGLERELWFAKSDEDSFTLIKKEADGLK